jgi:hypothetical protein
MSGCKHSIDVRKIVQQYYRERRKPYKQGIFGQVYQDMKLGIVV